MSEQFKLGLLYGDGVEAEDVAPGYEFLEIPLGIRMIPFQSEAVWQHDKAEILAHKTLPTPVCSHFFNQFGLRVTGPDADWEQLEFWTKRALKRCTDIGVEVAGVYGSFFPVPDGYSRNKAREETIKYLDMLAGYAEQYGVLIALEPMAKLNTVFPRYLDGLEIAKETGRKSIRVMADLNYFLTLGQPLKVISEDPEYCLHVHVQGDGGAQPNVGNREEIFLRLFTILKDIGYTRGVSAACPWKSTTGLPLDLKYETAVTIDFLKKLRAKVYGG